jgi:hypothetical protein
MTGNSSFDPFNDRIARDIRNELSVSFVKSLEEGSFYCVRSKAQSLVSVSQVEQHKKYIADRLKSYEDAFYEIRDAGIKDPVTRALVLWDSGLFFEVHELLEKEWLRAKGERKKALQGLIRAAGMYIHLEQGNLVGAQKMAEKAADALDRFGDRLLIKRLDALLDCLIHLNPVPPRLYCRKKHI